MNNRKVFLLGVTGYIGGSLGVKLIEKGYSVSGLVRDKATIEKIRQLGIEPIYSESVTNLPSHTAFKEAEIILNATDTDEIVLLATILSSIKETGKTYIHTSGAGIVGDKAAGNFSGEIIYSEPPKQPLLERIGRVAIENEIMRQSTLGIHTVIICPTMVYGKGSGLKKNSIQIPALINAAKRNNGPVLIGKGANLTSNVHIDDLTDLYVLAIENAESRSFFYAENGTVSFLEIGESIAKYLGCSTNEIRHLSMNDAYTYWDPMMANFSLGSNILVNSKRAREELNWKPIYNDILKNVKLF